MNAVIKDDRRAQIEEARRKREAIAPEEDCALLVVSAAPPTIIIEASVEGFNCARQSREAIFLHFPPVLQSLISRRPPTPPPPQVVYAAFSSQDFALELLLWNRKKMFVKRRFHCHGLLQHQNSTASFQKNYKSCMWDWLRIFDLHNRLSVKRLLEDDVHGSRRHVRRVKIPEVHVPLSVDEHDNLDDETKLLIVNKGNQTKKSSGKALVRALIFKKMFRKHNQKQKMLPVKPRLMRTVSIHHLECSDYVLPVEMASDTATSKVDFHSQKSDSSESHEHDQLLPANKKHQVCGTIKHVNHVGHTELTRSTEKQANLVEKLHKTQDALLKQMESSEELGRDVFQSNDFITTKEFINEQGESFLEIIEEPDILLENYLQDLHRSSSERALMKSGSSPMVGLSAKRHDKSPNDHHLVNQEVKSLVQKSEPAIVDMHNAYYNSEFSPRSFRKHAKQGDHGTLLSHSRTVKKKLKDVFNENRKEHLHISMDGHLHKIPYGHTASGNVMKEKLFDLPQPDISKKA
ncbi:unnamed protein product [Musa textilis]